MAGLRPGKKRGKNGGKGAAAASLGFGHAPFFFCKCLFFCRVFGNGLLLGFSLTFLFFFFVFFSISSPLYFVHTLRSVFIVLESLRV